MKTYCCFIIFCLLLVSKPATSQSFVNGDLEAASSAFQQAPPGWEMVPFTDTNCIATFTGGGTPDLLSISGPSIGIGVFGQPYSGNIFVSGVLGELPGNLIYQEGIKQEVDGFTVDSTYKITFYQTVVKQINAIDTSGSWIVYCDSILLDVSDVSISYMNWDDPNLQWEKRSIGFIAKDTSHILKFLPFDDDNNIWSEDTTEDAALRMGIDSIYIEPVYCNGSQATYSNISGTVCGKYTVPSGDETYYVSGMYQDTILNSIFCDSIITINLTILPSEQSDTSAIVCDSITWRENTYFSSGFYADTLTNIYGCDSIYTLDLVVNYSYLDILNLSTCESFYWPTTGLTYTSSGVYVLDTITISGCDSIMTLNLTINQSSQADQWVYACNNYFWPVDGQTYFLDGNFNGYLINSVGCDSIITLHLTLDNPTTTNQTVTSCGNYFWPITGTIYNTSGTYTGIVPSEGGCDSTVIIDLEILPLDSTIQIVSTCESYTWIEDGNTYTSSGIYMTSVLGSDGCDSLLYLDLSLINYYAWITQFSSALYGNPTNGDSYVWVSCPSMIPISGADSLAFTPQANGDYAVIISDSTCIDTSACFSYFSADLKDLNPFSIQVYPNPFHDEINIVVNQGNFDLLSILVQDVTGKIVYKKYSSNSSQAISLEHLANGTYYLMIEYDGHIQVEKIIKF